MGLASFSATMISIELMLLTDQDYGRLSRWIETLRCRRDRASRAPPLSPAAPPAAQEKVGAGVD